MKKSIIAILITASLILAGCSDDNSSTAVNDSVQTKQPVSDSNVPTVNSDEQGSPDIEDSITEESSDESTDTPLTSDITYESGTTTATSADESLSSLSDGEPITTTAVTTQAPPTSQTTPTVTTTVPTTAAATTTPPPVTTTTATTPQTTTTTAPIVTTAPTTTTLPTTTPPVVTTTPPVVTTTPQTTTPTTTEITTTTPPPSTSNGDYANEMLTLVNAERAKVGAAPLTLNSTLSSAANARAKEAAELFSHTRPNGSTCFTILGEFGLGYTAVGENIAAGYSSASATMHGWVTSPGHYSNIISEGFTEIGIGYYYDPTSTYGHYWVQIFRRP